MESNEVNGTQLIALLLNPWQMLIYLYAYIA
jgi:hypothetical protein